jgi:hypothetical protein
VALLTDLLPTPIAEVAGEYVRLRLRTGHLEREADGPGAYAEYADPLVESLFHVVQGTVELVTGCAISPSYGFLRIYTAGAQLAPHTDRAACMYTLTLPLAGDCGGMEWPLCARGLDGQNITVAPSVGSGVLMLGQRVQHWREPLETGWLACAFLHWVAPDGPEELKFDGRPSLGPWAARNV